MDNDNECDNQESDDAVEETVDPLAAFMAISDIIETLTPENKERVVTTLKIFYMG